MRRTRSRGDVDVLRVAADHLHVDRRRQAEVQDLRHHVGGLEEEDQVGEALRQDRAQALDVGRGRPWFSGLSETRISPSAADTIEVSLNARLTPPAGMPDVVDHHLDLVRRG